MKTPLTHYEKSISFILLVIGICLTYQAIPGYIDSYIIYYNYPTSYRIAKTTYVSNLLNGNLLVISSLLFLKNKSRGALFYQCTAIMFILYAINFNLYDLIVLNRNDGTSIVISILILLFGILLYLYFNKKNFDYQSKLIPLSIILLGIITYSYMNLYLCDWVFLSK